MLDAYRAQIAASTVLAERGLTEGGYLLVSAHREENVDLPVRLRALLDCLVAARDATGLPVFVSTHPRTRKRLEALPGYVAPDGVTFSAPLGFHDYNRLHLGAACVLSDSGTIAEESTLLGFPAVAAGRTRSGVSHVTPEDYLIDNTSERVVSFIVSTVRRHHQWAGIRRPDGAI